MATSRNIDFSNVKDGGGNFTKKRVKEGDYLAKITKVDDAESKEDKVPMYLFTIVLQNKANASYPYYCKLAENQLWKLRNLFIAGGKTVPKSKVKVDPNQLVGKLIGVTMEDSEYEKDGKTIEQSEVAAVFPAAELDGSGDDDSDGAVEDDDEDEDDSLDDIEDTDAEEEIEEEPEPVLDRTELKAAIKALDPTAVFKKSESDGDLLDRLTDLQADNATVDDEEEEDDEDEVIEVAPAKKAPARKTAAKKPAADIDDDELEGLDVDDL